MRISMGAVPFLPEHQLLGQGLSVHLGGQLLRTEVRVFLAGRGRGGDDIPRGQLVEKEAKRTWG